MSPAPALLLSALLLTGCAGVAPELSAGPEQAEAAALVSAYNARHGTAVPVPPVRVGGTLNLDNGEAYCVPADRPAMCWLTVSRRLDPRRTDQAVRHEVAHHVCALTVPGCGAEHGPAWRAIARELGVTEDDPALIAAD